MMPQPITVLPDDELALVQYLRSVPRVTALVPPEQIALEAGPDATYPLVLVQRIGGTRWPGAAVWVDAPTLQVDVFGPTSRRTCKVLAETVRGAILAIANDSVSQGVLVSSEELTGLQWLPDTVVNPPLPRYVARYRLVLHPFLDLGPQPAPWDSPDVTVTDGPSFQIDFPSAASVWRTDVPGDFGRLPDVTVYLPDGEQVLADIVVTETTVIVTFAEPQSGYLILN